MADLAGRAAWLAALLVALSPGCARVGPVEARPPASEAEPAAPPLPGPSVQRAGPAEPPVVYRLVYFLPDRLLDALDIGSFGVGIGYGFDIHQQITCRFHVPTLGAYQTINFLNWYHRRNLCLCTRGEAEFGLGPFVLYHSGFMGAGTGWDQGRPGAGLKTYADVGMGGPSDAVHQEGFRDPWAIGGHYGPFIVSPRVEFEIHPSEVVDFIVGTLTFGRVDLTQDDLLTGAFADGLARPAGAIRRP